MRKIFAYAVTIVAMLATTACSEKELTPSIEPDTAGQTINVRIQGNVAQTVQTKTGVNYDAATKVYHPYWNAGDQIGVFFDSFDSKTKLDAVIANTSEDKANDAVFSADNVKLNNGTVPSDNGRIYSFYPASAFHADGVVAADQAVRVNLKAIQTPAAVDTYDPAADILVGQPSEYLYEDGLLVADIAFARAMSVVKVTLKAGNGCPAGLAVNSFTMTAPEETILTGRAKLSLAALFDDASPILDWTVKNNTVTANYEGDYHPVIGGAENTVYVVVNPTSIASGDVIFSIDAGDYTIEKTISLSKALAFPQSNVANIGLTIDGANCTLKVPETRILVESFNKTPNSGEQQMEATATGVTGTGVSENLTYTYSTAKTNIRATSNGQSKTNPYLWISGANQSLTMNNILVDNETALQLSYKAKTTQGEATVTVKYKESSSATWNIAGTGAVDSKNWKEYATLFNISSTVESLDIQIVGSDGFLMVDDIVLEKYVDSRTPLANPTNVSASLDSETPNRINVSWTAVEHADKYEVVLSASDEEDVVLCPTTNSVSATRLVYEKEYTIKVKAVTTDPESYIDSDYVNAPSTVTTGSKPAGAATWDETAFEDLAEGDQVVIVGTSGENTYAMSNNNGTSSAPTAVSINVAGTALAADPVETLIWYVGVSDGNKIFYSDEDNTKWLYCTSTNNGVRVGVNTDKTFAWENSYLKHVGTSRYIGVYDTSDWRCYSTSKPSTHTNIGSQSFKFYVCSNKETKYSVSVGEVDGGTLSADPTKAAEGATVTLSAEANEGWQFNDDWSVDNGNVTVADGTFTMPARNVNVTGSFSKISYTITDASGANGLIGISKNPANYQDVITLTPSPETGYRVKAGTLKAYKTGDKSTIVTISDSSTITMPSYPVTIECEFEDESVKTKKTATLTISASFTKDGNLTDDKSNTWAVSSDGSYTGNTAYIQVGTNKSQVSYLKLSTSAYKDIEKIQVWGTSKANSLVSPKINIDGSTVALGSEYTSQNASSGGTEFSKVFSPRKEVSSTLEIEISREKSATGAIYFNKLIVTYYE